MILMAPQIIDAVKKAIGAPGIGEMAGGIGATLGQAAKLPGQVVGTGITTFVTAGKIAGAAGELERAFDPTKKQPAVAQQSEGR